VFDAPLDTWYVWLGLGAVSLAVAGTVLSFPTASPASTGAVADAVDTVAASDYQARDEVTLPAGEMRLGPRTFALRTDATTAQARFAYGPVIPVQGDGRLRRVLRGSRPEAIFDDQQDFERALVSTRRPEPRWRETPAELTIRRVAWGDVDATLVG
jgi:hypothetical protein